MCSRRFSILFCVLLFRAVLGVKIETLKYCCGLGANYANSGLKCISFQTPIAGVQKEDELSCLNSIDVCCKNQYRTSLCNLGKDDAKAGKTCQSSDDSTGSDLKKDCCEACALGIETGKTGQPCIDNLGLGPPYDSMFIQCCKDAISPSSSSEAPTTTAETETTTTESSTAVQEENALQRKNRTPSEPPLDNPCDIGDICAQICIPTPDSYKCECYKGYTLMADKISCKPDKKSPSTVDRCSVNNPCEHKCIDTGVAIKCACTDGFELAADKRSCKDIDECALNLHDCAANEVCVNDEGYYYCEDPSNTAETEYNLAKCPEGYTFNGVKQVCDDIDECIFGLICPRPKVCVNTIGSFTCEGEDAPQCPPGFHFKSATAACEDIDECLTAQDDCNRESQICLNTKGNFTCIDKVSKKSCPPGFKKNVYTQNCEDINECEETEDLCAANEECVNEPGGHNCVLKTPFKSASVVPAPPVYNYPSFPLSSTTTKSTTASSTTTEYTPSTTVSSTSTEQQSPKPSAAPVVPSPMPIPHYNSQNPFPKWFSNPTPNFNFYQNRPSYVQPLSCSQGYEHSTQTNKCEDIDECRTVYNACHNNQDCYNTPGSYICNCKPGFSKDYSTGGCVDVNECQLGSHDCGDGQRCDNTIGSYQCARVTGCGTGYTLNSASGLCEDDDECILGTDNCRSLGNKYQCRNTLGSYRCERVKCTDCFVSRVYTSSTRFVPVRTEPTRNYPVAQAPVKICLPGYVMSSAGQCEDIDECASNPCGKGEKCNNLNGRYQCIKVVQCTRGYELNEAGDGCVDVNECARGIHKCTAKQVCKNGPGYYTCQCLPGHQINTYTSDCEDIDECKLSHGRVCSIHAECINTIGSYQCRCKPGYVNKGDACEDIDECGDNRGLCEHKCVNVWGSYRCSCNPGFTLNSDNRTCSDIDECEKFKDSKLCIGTCQNVPGSYTCKCPPGYKLGSDQRVCKDIDECEQNICPSEDVCLNTRGGHKCHAINCPPNYIRDPDHKSRCKRASNVCDPRDSRCLTMPEQYSYHFVTLVSRLPIPPNGIPFFHMKGPDWNLASADFTMTLVNVHCPYGVRRADESNFYVKKFLNGIQIYLMQSIQGPQEIELKVEMKLYVKGTFGGLLVANIFVIVSEYEF